jgi:hypothetical protein
VTSSSNAPVLTQIQQSTADPAEFEGLSESLPAIYHPGPRTATCGSSADQDGIPGYSASYRASSPGTVTFSVDIRSPEGRQCWLDNPLKRAYGMAAKAISIAVPLDQASADAVLPEPPSGVVTRKEGERTGTSPTTRTRHNRDRTLHQPVTE